MKLEENLTHKMLKILRFFRRERRSVNISDESIEAGKGLTLFQHLALNKSFFSVFIFSISFTNWCCWCKRRVCYIFSFSLFIVNSSFFFVIALSSPAECHFITSHSNSIFERTENVANPTLYSKFVKNNKK